MTLPNTGHALITGASSGIGEAIAREYARRGKPLVLTARRADRLHALAHELGESVPCHVVVADLAVRAAPQAIFAETEARGLFIDTLVNNAGYGIPGSYLIPSWETHAAFLQVMVTAVCEMTYLYLPAMQRAARGRILNIASFAALVPGSAGHTLYAGVKSFLIKFSESLGLENAGRGVNVTALCPGFTYSEFHDKTGTRDLVSKLPKWMWLDNTVVARLGIDAVESGKPLVVPGIGYKAIRLLAKHLPDATVRRLMAKRSQDFRDAS